MEKRYENSVFINCPFDESYKEIFYAIIFTVYRCGFVPRSSLEQDNALDNRLSKIEKLIESCQFGVHDISRTEVNINSLPRFNMPFELGVFFGAKKFGNKKQKTKNALVIEQKKYLYHEYISDLNGIDTKAHNNNPEKTVKIIRDWLYSSSPNQSIDGHVIIAKDFVAFRHKLPAIINEIGLEINGLQFNDYCYIVEQSLSRFMK